MNILKAVLGCKRNCWALPIRSVSMVDSYRRDYPPSRLRCDLDSPPTKPRNHYDSYHPARDEQRRTDGTHPERRNSLACPVNDSGPSQRPGILSRRAASEYGKQSGVAFEDPKNYGQSTPNEEPRSRPTSPNGNIPRSGAATPTVNISPFPLPANRAGMNAAQGPNKAPLKSNRFDPQTPSASAAPIPTVVQTAPQTVTDPRLRRINTQLKPNSETRSASPTSVKSVQGETGSNTPEPRILTATTLTMAEGTSRPAQTPADAVRETDVVMTDFDMKTVIDGKTHEASAEDPCDPLSSFISLLTKVCGTSSSIAFHGYERAKAQEHRDLCRKHDERAKRDFRGYLPHLEDAEKNRKKAEAEYERLDKKLQGHLKAQNEAVKALAQHFMGQVDDQKKLQELGQEHIEMLKNTSEEVKKISGQLSTISGDASVAKDMAQKAMKEPNELMTRALNACSDAQQTAKKTQMQANKLSDRLSAVEEGQPNFQRTVLQVNNLSERFDHMDDEYNKFVSKNRDRVYYLEDSTQKLRDDHRRLNDSVKQLEKEARRIPDIEKDVNMIKAECNALRGAFKQLEKDIDTIRGNEASSSTETLGNRLSELSDAHDELADRVNSQYIALNNSLQSQEVQKTDIQRHAHGLETLQEQVKNRIHDAQNKNVPAAEDTSNDAPSPGLQIRLQGLQSEVEKLQHTLQALNHDVKALGGPSEIPAIQESISSLRGQVEFLKNNAGATPVPVQLADPTPAVSQVAVLKDDFERLVNEMHEAQQKQAAQLSTLADRLKDCEDNIGGSEAELGKELDALQQGQTKMQETFTERYAGFETILDEMGKTHDVKVEAATVDLKAEVQTALSQMQSLTARVDKFSNVAASSRPTPPSAPPTPQMQTTAQLTELTRGSSSPVMESTNVLPLVTKLQADFADLQMYIGRQLPRGLNLPALNLQNVPVMVQNMTAMHTALSSLNQRYNSLTTEPMVQAMVQQMQLMYPSAATTQAELQNQRSVIVKMQEDLSKLHLLQSTIDAHTTTIAQLNGKVVSGDKEREQLLTLLKEERDKLNHKVQEVTDSLNERLHQQHDRLTERVHQQHDSLNEQMQEQHDHLKEEVKQDLLKQRYGTDVSIKECQKFMSEFGDSVETVTTGIQKDLDGVKDSVQNLLARVPSRDGSDTPRSQSWAGSKTAINGRAPPRRESAKPLGTPDDVQRQDLLKSFKPRTSPTNRQPPTKPIMQQQVVDDSEGDSDAPLLERSNSSRVNTNPQSPASSTNTNAYFSASTKRKRGAEEHTPDRPGTSEIKASPRREKVPRPDLSYY